MNENTTVGIDLAKHLCVVWGANYQSSGNGSFE